MRPIRLITCLLLGLLLLQVLSLRIGAVAIGWGEIWASLSGNASASATGTTIVWNLRLQRILLGTVVGAGLGASGAAFQGLFRNPLADPYLIGASSGAALGVASAVVLGLRAGLSGLPVSTVAGMCGAVAAVGLVCLIAHWGGHLSALSLLLAGVAVSSFTGALVSLLMFLNDREMAAIFHWILGDLAGQGAGELRMASAFVLTGTLLLWGSSRVLDALTFGEEAATALGVDPFRSQMLVVLAASLTTAAAVAVAGTIGFVGLVAPHAARFLIGARHGHVIPASAIIGAILLVSADDLARSLAPPAELPVGVVTALLGSPFFVVLLKLRQRELGAVS